MNQTTAQWLKAAGIRALKTFAQSAAAMLPAAATRSEERRVGKEC